MKTKKIIERNLSLNQKYTLIRKTYIPIIDSCGTYCQNCFKPLANIATVKGETDNKTYTVGFDCLETFLLNNNLLDGQSIESFEIGKKSLSKVKNLLSYISTIIEHYKNVTTLKLYINPTFKKYIEIYYYSGDKCVWNDAERIKEFFDIDMLIESLKAKYPAIDFKIEKV